MRNECVANARSEFKHMKKETKVQINEKTMVFYGFASSGTAAIITLNVSFTDIRIPFVNASFTNLLMFHAAYNGLEKIDDIGNETGPSLKLLNLSHNALTDVKSKFFPYLKELEILDLSSNCFTHFHFEHDVYRHENLKKLFLQNNLIHKVEWPTESYGIRHTLDFLDLSNNYLKIFNSVSMAFKTLLINNNALEKLFYQEMYTFGYKCHLEAQHNHIYEFLSTFEFSHLNLSYNEMESLDDLYLFKLNIDMLDLSHNKIKSTYSDDEDEFIDYTSDFDYPVPRDDSRDISSAIKNVNLSYNQIENLHQVSGMIKFKNCLVLNLEGNKMANLSYDKIRSEFKSLTHMNLKNNPLTKVDLNEMKFHNTTQFMGIHFDYDDPDKKEEIKKIDSLTQLVIPIPPTQNPPSIIQLLSTTETLPSTTKLSNYIETSITTSTTSTTTSSTKVTTTTTKSEKSTDNKAGIHHSIWIWITVIGIVLITPLVIFFVFLRKRFQRWTSAFTPRTYNEVENFL